MIRQLFARRRAVEPVEECWLCTEGATRGPMCRRHERQLCETVRRQAQPLMIDPAFMPRRRWSWR